MTGPDLEFRPVDVTNYFQVMHLELVDGQQRFLWTNAGALAEAAYVPDMFARAIYAGHELVGLVTWGGFRANYDFQQPAEPGSYIIDHLMIAAPFQGRGYGRRALAQTVACLSALPDCRRIVLSVDRDNAAAWRLYADAGFRFIGKDHDNDPVLEFAIG